MSLRYLLFCISVITGSLLFSQTTIVIKPDALSGKDADIFDLQPDRNYGNSQNLNLEAWTWEGEPGKVRSLMSFDISNIPEGVVITQAYLSLYFAAQPDLEEHSTLDGSNACTIQRVIEDWDEDSVTWNNQPNTTSENEVIIPQSQSSTQDYPKIDITAMVQDIYDSPSGNFGFLIKLETEQHYRRMVFASSDYSDTALHPKLTITYESRADDQHVLILQPDSEIGKDAMVFSNESESNYGNYPNMNMEAWTWKGLPGITRSLIEFDLSLLPYGVDINKAYLSLYFAPQPDIDDHSTLNGPNSCIIQRIIEFWEEDEVNWINQPNTTTENQVIIPQSYSSTQDYPNMDVTEMVQDMYTEFSNYGFLVRLEFELYYRRMVFASSDYLNALLHPKLEIFYEYDDINTPVTDINNISLNVYPNPASDYLKIDFLNNTYCTVELINANGQLVLKTESEVSRLELDVSNIPTGIYFIRIRSNNYNSVEKVIIN